ncbi:hypothetical protein [Anabaena azotica]|uniref:Uncharacterized protein n=1 Tax=Anabaena azotica FACHB-119 TaxID=947527 RepID=A0ABR8DE19_9NOST|nr:hypothetical protein [Anabaena azotica]MBD2504620.1 hypothetical protein [Anabaena azotica FACHB-119]
MSLIEINQPQTVTIKARERWNETKIYLEVNATYLLEVQGEQFWYDWHIKSDANGYTEPSLRYVEFWRRSPSNKWFALMGNINRKDNLSFLIGKKITYTPTINGELFCYANDLWSMYWNNTGQLLLTITRLT